MTAKWREPVSVSRALGTVVVTVHGALDDVLGTRLRAQLLDVVDRGETSRVFVDLRDVDVIDTAGVAIVVDVTDRIRHKGGRVVLSGPREEVASLLERAGLSVTLPSTDRSRAGRGEEADRARPLRHVTFGPVPRRAGQGEWAHRAHVYLSFFRREESP